VYGAHGVTQVTQERERNFMKLNVLGGLALAILLLGSTAEAQEAVATAPVQDAKGTDLGTVTFTDTAEGLEITIDVTGLPPGKHGLHVHTEGSCEASTDDQGTEVMHGSAGGHFDPATTENHAGPDVDSQMGHAGDLPSLEVAEDGTAKVTFITTKMTVAEGETSVLGRALMIHANEDNYTNEPKNGGSGDRIACGVIGLQ
jgi:superoxide dismutase, Cu-Zn family